MIKLVTSCTDCPCRSGFNHCRLLKADVAHHVNGVDHACPLKNEPLLLTIKRVPEMPTATYMCTSVPSIVGILDPDAFMLTTDNPSPDLLRAWAELRTGDRFWDPSRGECVLLRLDCASTVYMDQDRLPSVYRLHIVAKQVKP